MSSPRWLLLVAWTWLLLGPVGAFHHVLRFGVLGYIILDQDSPTSATLLVLGSYGVRYSPILSVVSLALWLIGVIALIYYGRSTNQSLEAKDEEPRIALDPLCARLCYHLGPLGPPVDPSATLDAREADFLKWKSEISKEDLLRVIHWSMNHESVSEPRSRRIIERNHDEALYVVSELATKFGDDKLVCEALVGLEHASSSTETGRQ